MNGSPLVDWRRLRARYIGKTLLLTLPGCLVGPYLVGLILGLQGREILVALLAILPPIVLLVVGVQQFLVSGYLCRKAVEVLPNDAPGARLQRLLELPRKLELICFTLCYAVGAPLFTWICCLAFQRSLVLVPVGFTVGLALAAIVGIPSTLLFQKDVLPLALEEFHRSPKARPPLRGGMFWPRQSWYLPYAFSV
ncbi:MAG TPA: hypothetical protein VEY30_11325, partial [Myxococcaceae bacterium]|nr:hypothetical protein [Myxococcaceae bacterium]